MAVLCRVLCSLLSALGFRLSALSCAVLSSPLVRYAMLWYVIFVMSLWFVCLCIYVSTNGSNVGVDSCLYPCMLSVYMLLMPVVASIDHICLCLSMYVNVCLYLV